MESLHRSLALVAALVCLTPRLHAASPCQGGWTTEKSPSLGLMFPRARDYEPIPTQPDETWVVLRFAEKIPKAADKQKPLRPEMFLVWIDFVPDPPPTAGTSGSDQGGSTAPPPGEGDDAQASGAVDKKPPALPISSIERYVDRELTNWTLGRPIDVKARGGYQGREYPLTLKDPKTRKLVGGHVFAYTTPLRTVAVIGWSTAEEFDKQSKIWRFTFERLDIDEPEEQSTEKLERMYVRKPFLDPAFRIAARKKLVRGWKAEDTDHFIVVYDTPDEPLMRKVCRDLELLRSEYMHLFPPVGEVNAVSTVRICKSEDEYRSYGGPARTAGYWNYATEELVLYDAEKLVKQRQDDSDTFIVLYHEAFHQYIHYSTGELPPHSWFNEGHGDYFSGAQVRDGKVRSIGVNPWRVDHIQRVVVANDYVPWEQIVRYEQPQYYEKSKVGICYAQGWSMIYFLRTAKAVALKPAWAKILPTYFDTLKAAYAEELGKLADDAQKDDKKRAEAGLAARKKAADAAFAGVDFAEIESAWRDFVLELKPPKR